MKSLPNPGFVYARNLKKVGVPPEQAEVHEEFISQFIEGKLATKAELQEVKAELKTAIQEVKAELRGEINALRTELKAEIQATSKDLKGEFKVSFAELKNELILWIFGASFAQAGLIIAGLKLVN